MEYVLQILLLFGRTLDQCVGTYFVSQLLPFGRCYKFFRIRHSEVTFGACKKKKENKQRYWCQCVNGGDERLEIEAPSDDCAGLPINIIGTVGEKCLISGYHLENTLSNDVRLDME